LRLSPPRPDFELRIVPSAINAGAGQTIPITVYALRKDGFSGDIALALTGVPQTFALSGAVVPAGQDQVRLTLTLAERQEGRKVRGEEGRSALSPSQVLTFSPAGSTLPLGLEGRAIIGGREVVRQAIPADDMMQAFAYRHLVRAQGFTVTAIRRGATRTSVGILSELPVKIPLGGTARVRVTLPASKSYDKIQMDLSEPPEGITVRDVSSDAKGTDIVLQSDAAKTKPGLRGNLIVDVFGERTPPAIEGKPKPNRQRIPLGTLPAIPFEIVK